MNEVNITWHQHAVTRDSREHQNRHRGCVVWFTGLSGCGKSTVANVVDHVLHRRGVRTYLLDGDNVRHGLNASPEILEKRHSSEFAERFGLGFSAMDREENIRRVGSVAQLFCHAGLVILAAFVSPYRKDRNAVRQIVESERPGDFVEVFVNTPLEVCESRDPKGLYKMARDGKIQGFTGIDAPYESPENPELVLDGGSQPPEHLAEQVVRCLVDRQLIPAT